MSTGHTTPRTRGRDRLIAATERLQYALEELRLVFLRRTSADELPYGSPEWDNWNKARCAADRITRICKRKEPRYNWRSPVGQKKLSGKDVQP